MIDQLATIGIRRGHPFQPDAAAQQALTQAVAEARDWLDAQYADLFAPYADGARWALPVVPEFIASTQAGFTLPDAYPVDGRGIAYTYIFFSTRHLGKGQFYLMTITDRDGHPLDGAASYQLTVPPGVPVSQYWSATAYNRTTHTLIRDVPATGRSSNTPGLQQAADGTITLWFGPQPPTGQDTNWIPTRPGEHFEVLFRFYGPQPPLFDKTWHLPDIERAPA
jgi:hypothetical protein